MADPPTPPPPVPDTTPVPNSERIDPLTSLGPHPTLTQPLTTPSQNQPITHKLISWLPTILSVVNDLEFAFSRETYVISNPNQQSLHQRIYHATENAPPHFKLLRNYFHIPYGDYTLEVELGIAAPNRPGRTVTQVNLGTQLIYPGNILDFNGNPFPALSVFSFGPILATQRANR